MQHTTSTSTATPASTLDTITLGGGCFWCLDAVYARVRGVVSVDSGYSNGQVLNPTYSQVCGGDTGHNEVVQLQYDPGNISLTEILEIFFLVHDATTLNAQGNDVGTQYRSGIYFSTPEQERVAKDMIRQMTADKLFSRPIVTEVLPLNNYSKAEDYHQDFFAKNPNQGYCVAVAGPKVAKLRKTFADRVKS
ncbi:MAG: peptide-methionine (S)-S-oxide reductase MsrA [Burkholderiaceae bacterium]